MPPYRGEQVSKRIVSTGERISRAGVRVPAAYRGLDIRINSFFRSMTTCRRPDRHARPRAASRRGKSLLVVSSPLDNVPLEGQAPKGRLVVNGAQWVDHNDLFLAEIVDQIAKE